MKSGIIKEIFENWSEIEIYLKIEVSKIKFKNWSFEKLNLKEIRVLKINWELEFWKLVLRIGILEIKFERNWNFENYLKMEVLKIKFKNWN